MQPDFAHTDDQAEQVLDSPGIAHHLVRLEFWQVDDDVRFQGISGNFQLVECACLQVDRNRLFEWREVRPG